MPLFRRKRSYRGRRRFGSKSRVKRRFGRKRFSRKGRKFRPTTTKARPLMSDRTFTNFKYVSITSASTGYRAGSSTYTHYNLPQSNDYGMLVVTNDTSTGGSTNATLQMFVFSPNYTGSGSGNAVFSGNEANQLMLPGNALPMVYYEGIYPLFSDSYEQLMPTGVSQWAQFYQNYICHGSSVDVTLVDSSVPGQLFVMPVTDLVQSATGGEPSPANYTFNTVNSLKVTQFLALPDEQPYCRIKFVSQAGGIDKVRIKHKMLTKKLFDIKSLTDDSTNKAELINPSTTIPEIPNNQWSWLIGFIPSIVQNESTGTYNAPVICTVQVKVVYHCELVDRNTLPYSSNLF